MADIFHEVEEDLRSERYQRLWQRYSGVLVGAALAVVLGVGGYVYYKDRTLQQQALEGGRYAEALRAIERGETDQALAGLGLLAQESTSGFGFLARLKQAEVTLTKGDKAAGLAILDQLSGDTAFDGFYRDYAVYRAALVRTDTDEAQTVIARLQPLLAPANPWRHLAGEIVGLLDLKAGRKAEARQRLQALADDLTAPAGVRGRAAEVLASLGTS